MGKVKSWAYECAEEQVDDIIKGVKLGKITKEQAIIDISNVHIYLTYPFVLSWSMLEAMSLEKLVIGSKTKPVEEIIKDKHNGLLFDFFDFKKLAEFTSDVLSNPTKYEGIRKNARKTIIEKYDLKKNILPKQLNLIEGLLE